jgi:2'-5' RNA ligase
VVVSEGRRRLFVAVPLSGEVQAALVERLDGVAIPGRVVPPENWHLTLRFLGWVDQVGYERLLGALDSSDLGSSFRMGLGALGAFPRPSKATVVWVAVTEGVDRLEELAVVADEAALDAGFEGEERPFRAHLTLSRVRPQEDVSRLVDGFAEVGLSWRCETVVVYQSHTGRGGPRYEALETFPLTR